MVRRRGGAGDLAGTARLIVDGVEVAEQAVVKTAFGDSLNRPIGINRWAGGGGDYNQGMIFNPSVSLGIVPEPATAGVIAAAGLLILARRRRQA